MDVQIAQTSLVTVRTPAGCSREDAVTSSDATTELAIAPDHVVSCAIEHRVCALALVRCGGTAGVPQCGCLVSEHKTGPEILGDGGINEAVDAERFVVRV